MPIIRYDDKFFEAALDKIKPKPVFIIGLHRSGTTFLYQTLTHYFQLANLTIYDVVNYDRILCNFFQETASSAKKKLDKIFENWNMQTRGIDDIALSHATHEEYGWILRSKAGAFHTNAKTASLLNEICRKLQLITPTASDVLLKNPFDTGHVRDLLDCFPDARFIFLNRDPVAIVNSQFGVARYFSENKNPFINMLFGEIPMGRAWMWLQRAVRKTVGPFFHSRLALCYILQNVKRELSRLETSWNLVPQVQRLALNYEALVNNQAATLKRIAVFLQLSQLHEANHKKPELREIILFPEVAAVDVAFRQLLRNKGIS